MKKLVALIAVLAVASMASATMMNYVVDSAAGVTVNGNTVTIDKATYVGSTFTIRVVGDIAAANFTMNVFSNNDGTYKGTVNPFFTTPNNPGTEINGKLPLVIYKIQGTNTGGTLAAGQTLYTFTSDAALGTWTYDGGSSNNGSGPVTATKIAGTTVTMPTLTVNVIQTPEPMTLALLGLGGLFLRRKTA